MMLGRLGKEFGLRFQLLLNPNKGYSGYKNISFETCIYNYLLMLLFCSILAGLIIFLYQVLYSAYLDLFLKADIDWPLLCRKAVLVDDIHTK